MMVTPLGDGRLALADAGAGAAIAERALRDDVASVAAFEERGERHFFGHPSIGVVAGRDRTLTPPTLRGRSRDMIDKSRAIAPVLDEVASSLEQYGYQVVRVPFLFGGPETEPSPDENEQSPRAGYPMLTYNNVLVESDASGSRVYLPRYGWPALDAAAQQAWEALGFEARAIDGLTVSAMYGGSLRCAVKVLAR